MQALAADAACAKEAKGPVVVRGSRAARADRQFELRLASSCKDINAGMTRSQMAHP